MWQLLDHRAGLSPDAEMLIAGDERVTFGGLRTRVLNLAAGLFAEGVGSRTVLAWQLPTTVDAVTLSLALSRLGAIQVPMLPVYGRREVDFAVDQAGVERLITATDALPTGDPATLPAHEPTAEGTTTHIFYTSGTTGVPKGVRHNDRGIIAAGETMAWCFEITDADTVPIAFPIAHVGGAGWLATLMVIGCRAILFDGFDPAAAMAVMDREQATLAGGGTVFCEMLLASRLANPDGPTLSSVRAFLGGGAPAPGGLDERLIAAFGTGYLSSYGMTEAPILTGTRPSHDPDLRRGTEGAVGPGIEVTIVGEDGQEVGVGEEGEVRVAARQRFLGYVDAELDSTGLDELGRVRSGDLARIDEHGFIRITGRIKDVIIRKGENVSAKEVEDFLHRHPKVAEAAVIGLPDESRGERVCAVVALRPGVDAFTLVEVADYLTSEGLMRQKFPEQIEFLDILPRNATGKVLKHELRARYSGS